MKFKGVVKHFYNYFSSLFITVTDENLSEVTQAEV